MTKITDLPRKTAKRLAPRLFLITPPMRDGLDAQELEQVLAAGDVASLLIGEDAVEGKAFVSYATPLVTLAQARGVAVLLKGDHRLVPRLSADGFHAEDDIGALRAAVSALSPQFIVGAGQLRSRHQAMEAGEAGADYAFFGNLAGDEAPGNAEDLLTERAEWWQTLFVTPCVVLAPHVQSVRRLARAGADFIALGPTLWHGQDGGHQIIAEAQAEMIAGYKESVT